MNFCAALLVITFVAITTGEEEVSHVVKIKSIAEDSDRDSATENVNVIDYHNGTVVKMIRRFRQIKTQMINPGNKSNEPEASTKFSLNDINLSKKFNEPSTFANLSLNVANLSNRSSEPKTSGNLSLNIANLSNRSTEPKTAAKLSLNVANPSNQSSVRKAPENMSLNGLNRRNKSSKLQTSAKLIINLVEKSVTPKTSVKLSSKVINLIKPSNEPKISEKISSKMINPSNQSTEPKTSETLSSKVLNLSNQSIEPKTSEQLSSKVLNLSNQSIEPKTSEKLSSKVLNLNNQSTEPKTSEKLLSKVVNPSNQSGEPKTAAKLPFNGANLSNQSSVRRAIGLNRSKKSSNPKTSTKVILNLSNKSSVPKTTAKLIINLKDESSKPKTSAKLSSKIINPSKQFREPKMPLNVVHLTNQSSVPKSLKKMSLNTFNNMIEDVVFRILEKKLGHTAENILNITQNIQTIKGIQEDTNIKIDKVLKKQNKLMRTLVDESNITHNAIDELQSKVKAMENNQNKSQNLIQRDIRDSVEKLVSKFNIQKIDTAKKTKQVNKTLKSLRNAIKNIQAELTNNVEPIQKISYLKIKDIEEGQRNNIRLIKNEAEQLNEVRNLLRHEIKQIGDYHNSASKDLKRIFEINSKIENGIADITHKLAKGVESIKKETKLNTQKIDRDFVAINDKNVQLLREITEILKNQATKGSSINKINQIGKDLHDMRAMQIKLSKETLYAISEATKQLLSNKNDLSNIFFKSFENQKKLLLLVALSKKRIEEEIKNATDVVSLKINSTKNSIKTFIEQAKNAVNRSQNKSSERIHAEIKSSVDEIRISVLEKSNELLRDIITKVESARQKVEKALEKEFNKWHQILSKKHKVLKEIEKEIGSIKDLINKDYTKREKENKSLHNIIKTLDSLYQNLLKKLELLKISQKTKLRDVLQEIKDTRNTLKKAIEKEIAGVGSKYDILSKDNKIHLERIEIIDRETRDIGRNIENQINVFRNSSPIFKSFKVLEDFPKNLNNTVKIILDGSDLNKKVITKKLEGEVNKILAVINGTSKDLSRTLKKLGHQTKYDILNGTKTILNEINDTVAHKTLGIKILRNTHDIKKQIGKMENSLGIHDQKINHYLSSMRKLITAIKNTIKKESKNCNSSCQIGKDMINEFNEIKALIKTVIGLSNNSNNQTSTKIEEARQRIEQVFREGINDSKNQLSIQLADSNKILLNRLTKSVRQNQKAKKAILDRIETAYRDIDEVIDSNGKKILHVSKKVLKKTKNLESMIYRTKRYLKGLIKKSNEELSKEIGHHDIHSEILTRNLREILLHRLKKICEKIDNYSSYRQLARTARRENNDTKGVDKTIQAARKAGNDLIKEMENIIKNTRTALFNKIQSNSIHPMISNFIQLSVGNATIILNTTHDELGKKPCIQNSLLEKIKEIKTKKGEIKKIDRQGFDHHTPNIKPLPDNSLIKEIKENKTKKSEIKKIDSQEFDHQTTKINLLPDNSLLEKIIENKTIKSEIKKIDSQEFDHHTTKKNPIHDKIQEEKNCKENKKCEIKDKEINHTSSKIIDLDPKIIGLLAHLLETRETLNDTIERTKHKLGSQIRKARRELEEIKEHGKPIEEQQEKMEELKSIYDTRKVITRLGKFINRDITQLMKYSRDSKKDIYEIVNHLLDDIRKTSAQNVQIFRNPEKLQNVLNLIQKAKDRILGELENIKKTNKN